VIELRTGSLAVQLDPGYGADVLSMRVLPGARELMWSSPWRARADAVIAGRPGSAPDSVSATLERYRGGWQTLCPNAGAPRAVHGAPVGFHGEVARSGWTVTDCAEQAAALRLDLFSVPVRIEREVRVTGARLSVADHLLNLSDQDLEIDYCQHPAFGGALLDGACVITTGARRFVSDPETGGILPPGQASTWPLAATAAGETLDLSRLPGPGVRRMVFGWLEDFDEHWYAVTNPVRGLSVRVEWDGLQMPYAWFWQELNHSVDYPWFRRARVQAIEPASTQTSGPLRRSVLRLGPGEQKTLRTSVTVTTGGGRVETEPVAAAADPTREGA
jgi:hypothetical protein